MYVKSLFPAAAALLSLTTAFADVQAADDRPPNIVFMFADDGLPESYEKANKR